MPAGHGFVLEYMTAATAQGASHEREQFSVGLHKLDGAGFMAQGMMKALGLKVKYDFKPQGEEKVEVPAGAFVCQKIAGKGSAETKIVFKKMKVESESITWISGKVPFGMVMMTSDDLVNGKELHSEAVVIEYGTSGAETQITKEPKEMPNLFGG